MPSRRSNAPMSPGAAHASAAVRMRSFSAFEKLCQLRRLAVATTSGSGRVSPVVEICWFRLCIKVSCRCTLNLLGRCLKLYWHGGGTSGEWVISTALKQIAAWETSGLKMPVSVNIGALQLQQADFAERLTAFFEANPEVPPQLLELEILESSAVKDISEVASVMKACQEFGVQFALDDFGTGYSSLTYLKELPARLIKIDRSFVRDMLVDQNDLAIIRGIIGLAKAFECIVIAEGVETDEHAGMLLELGCDLAQG